MFCCDGVAEESGQQSVAVQEQSVAVRGSKRPANRTGGSGALLATFLVSHPSDLGAAFVNHVHPNLRKNLGGVVLLSHGYTTSDLESFAKTLNCQVVTVNTFGIIGWSVDASKNVELEETGRGAELGLPGAKAGKPGITVIAVRKQEQGKKNPTLATEMEAIPTFEQGAVAHILMAPFGSQPEAEKVIFSDQHAVVMGGYAKEVFEFKCGKWEERHLAVITFMISETATLNVFHSYGAYKVSGGLPASECEGRIVADTLPEGYLPVFVASFQCTCLGSNAFGKSNVESRAMNELWGKDVPSFGMFCAAEIGNSFEVNPCGWNAQHKASEATTLHSFCSCMCVFAEKVEESPYSFGITRSMHSSNPDEVNEAQKQSLLAVPPRGSINKDAPEFEGTGNFKDYLRAMPFKDVGMPDPAGTSFWTWPGGMLREERYEMSVAVDAVDCFISHALRTDPQAAKNSPMATPILYAIHKATDVYVASHVIVTRQVATGKITQDQAMDTMMALNYWIDIACVDQLNVAKKMHIIKEHLGDFVHNAKYIVVLVSTHYFKRAWCLYEFCVCLKAYTWDFIVISNAALSWFISERLVIADSVVNASFEKANCYDPADKALIEARIKEEFVSVSHFNRLVKFAACALLARANLPFGVEFYSKWYTVWGETAQRCGFVELASVINEVDMVGLRKKLRDQIPDLPAETKAKERMALCGAFTNEWFDTKVAPMLAHELKLATMRSRARGGGVLISRCPC